MEYRHINLGNIQKEEPDNYIYIIPRSNKPNDFMIISPISEQEILEKGQEGKLIFQAYSAVLTQAEKQVKQYLKDQVHRRFNQNRKKRLLSIPLAAFLILVSLINILLWVIDDLAITILVGYLAYRMFKKHVVEQQNYYDYIEQIDRLEFQRNPLLDEVFQSFSRIDTNKPELINLHRAADVMDETELKRSIDGLDKFICKKESPGNFLETLFGQKKTPHIEPGFLELYKDLINRYKLAFNQPGGSERNNEPTTGATDFDFFADNPLSDVRRPPTSSKTRRND